MFDVDVKGLAKVLERRGRNFVLLELIQNALDEHGVTEIEVTTSPSTSRDYTSLVVKDDAPDGFKDLRHAYTLFAESAKKSDVHQRGRWNLGEKLVIAMCRTATIETTTGTLTFESGVRTLNRRKRTKRGSVFTGECRMTRVECEAAVEACMRVLVPHGIRMTVNGARVEPRYALGMAELVLPTEVADPEGYLRPTRRKTDVHVYQRKDAEQAHLYELGIPVVPIECDWHVDVGQKIPLNSDRDNVTPAYLREIHTCVVNLVHELLLDQEIVASPWVSEALASPNITPEAVRSVVAMKHGPKRVAYDPSDPEGTKIAVTQGYEVVHGGSYTKAQWDNIRRANAIQPAGQVTPSPRPFSAEGKGEYLVMLDRRDDAHNAFVDYAKQVAKAILDTAVVVYLANDPSWPFRGAYAPGRLTVNVSADPLWWAHPRALRDPSIRVDVDAFLIHEYAHHRVRDHLSHKFHEECCRLGARLARACRRDGELFAATVQVYEHDAADWASEPGDNRYAEDSDD